MNRIVPSWCLVVYAGALACAAGCGGDDASDADASLPTAAAGSMATAGNGGIGGTAGAAGTSAGTAAQLVDASADLDDASVIADAGDAGSDSGVFDPGTEGDGDFSVGPTYTTDPDLTDHGAPKGEEFQFTMSSTDSQIFKGDDATLNTSNQHPFTREIRVYVPHAYVDGDAAPILVIQDGPGPLGLVERALDNLTGASDPARRLPAFIAIAVANGGGDSKGSERGLEYDTLSDRYARFIVDEVLPAVLANAQIKAKFPQLAFTANPEGRAALGCSSGGAAALTMGWFRPDLFRRLITYSGTFVDQQDDDAAEEATYPLGAWDYHSGKALIANTAKKPLRVFLHASDHDNGWDQPEAGHHNWVMANMRTAAALGAKGYHYRFVSAVDAGHCDGKVFNQTLAQTLAWTWRGYPTN